MNLRIKLAVAGSLLFAPHLFALSKTKEKSLEVKVSQTAAAPYETRFYPYKVNTMMGLNVIQGSALVSGTQFGYAPFHAVPFYVGPELNFSLFSPGSLFAVMAGGWYEMRVRGAEKVTISLGALGGPGFNSAIVGIAPTTFVGFLDAALSQEMDDLVNIRAQLRPGIVGRLFAFMMNFSVSFRFH